MSNIVTLPARGVPLRRVDCHCGFPWLSPPITDPVINGESNVCPKCASPALVGTVGPVRLVDLDDLKIDIRASASAHPEK